MFSHVFCRMKQLQDWENKPGHRTGMASSGAIGSSWALAWLGDHRLIGGVFRSTIGWNGTNCVLTSETGERNVQYLSKGNAVSKEESLGFAYDYFFIVHFTTKTAQPVPFSAPRASNDGQKPGPGIGSRTWQWEIRCKRASKCKIIRKWLNSIAMLVTGG